MTEHTPGPWGWFGTNHGFYLATTHSGRRFVMDFVRMGMRSAQPRFQVNSRMVNGADLVQFEVDRNVTGFAAGREAATVYRYDIVGIDHPDARLIAAAPETAAERDRLKDINADLQERAEKWRTNCARALTRATIAEDINADLLAALEEAEDKLHVFACNFPDGPDKEAAVAARDMVRAHKAKEG